MTSYWLVLLCYYTQNQKRAHSETRRYENVLHVGAKGKETEIMFLIVFSPYTENKILLWHSCLLLGQRFHWNDYGFRTPFCPLLNADLMCFTSTFCSGYILQPLTVWVCFPSVWVLTWKEELLPLNTHGRIKISKANKQNHKTLIHPA